MRKDHRFGDTADTIDKLPEFFIAVMALNDHSQIEVADMLESTQSEISRFCRRKGNATLNTVLKVLRYCEQWDPTGRSYRIVQLMNQ